jgi:uncharacterized protein YyaL (SSP411 family)
MTSKLGRLAEGRARLAWPALRRWGRRAAAGLAALTGLLGAPALAGPGFTNRLAKESSPYLLQHAHDPVDWFPWGEEAFTKARAEGKPVFLSIGYSTCHWCHVMEAESFEDPEVARALNDHFVAVKVDREERPAVDAAYMEAVELMTGQGGWPMTLVLDDARRPFFAATYLPARDGDREGLPGLLTVLRELQTAWAQDRAKVHEVAGEVVARLQAGARAATSGKLPGPEALAGAVRGLAASFDAAEGGFGHAPKFPRPPLLELLARAYRRTGDAATLEMLERTLRKMAAGGIDDQLGGGFHRYSTDARWRVPHFEKMLYDNALLASTYLTAYQLTGRREYGEVARTTLDYLDREMSDPSGGFWSATDADSLAPDGRLVEGWFFTWTQEELRAVLGPERSAVAAACFGVTEAGDLEGRSVLHVAEATAGEARPPPERCEEVRRPLLAARARRPAPRRDDKVVAAWNGLAVSAFARGALVLDEPRYAVRAARALTLLLGRMSPGGQLLRSWRGGRAGQPGTLEDLALVAQGALDLFEVTQEAGWLQAAVGLQRAIERRFRDPAGGYFLSADDAEPLISREKPSYDGPVPSGNAVAALNQLRLAELTGDPTWRRTAVATLQAFAGRLDGDTTPAMLAAVDFASDAPLEIVLVAPAGGDARALLDVVRRSYVPNRVLVSAVDGPDLARRARQVPLLQGRRALGGQATAYVCRASVCRLPTADPATLARLLKPGAR